MTAIKHRSPGIAAALLALALLSGCATETLVREPVVPDRLNEVSDRISDEAIRSDRQVIEQLRARLRKLNESGRWPLDNYHVCKAQAWIDFAETEYTDNDRGTVIESALREARALIVKMEADAENISTDTPLIAESMTVRKDLWDFVAQTKDAEGGRCIDCNLAKLEVQLVAAGHDHKELGWRHAASGVLASERLARTVRVGLDGCEAAAKAAVAAGGAAIGPAFASGVGVRDAAALAELQMPVVVHFAYDRSTLSNETAAVLARIAYILREYPQINVDLAGHTDSRGSDGYNDALGERRATAVRTYLLAAGIAPERVKLASKGKRESLQAEAERLRAYAMDRRVELVFGNLPQIGTERQLLDLQPDR